MKTIMDVFKSLLGDLNNEEWTCQKWHKTHSYIFESETFKGRYSLGVRDYGKAICTVDDFKALVKDLENWQPTLSVSPLANVTYAEYKAPFMNDNKESKPELVTVKGMQYEVGKSYITASKEIAILLGCGDRGNFIVEYPYGNSVFESESLSVNAKWTTGTITPAPVELVDGAAYLVDVECGLYKKKSVPLTYSKSEHEFFTVGCCFGADDCANITRLVPEVK